jgi:hypothetical protein
MAYQKLQDDLIDNFGISEDFARILETKIKIEKMYAKRDKKLALLIEIEEDELARMEAKFANHKGDMLTGLRQIEDIRKVPTNPREITVYEFYNLAKLVSKNNK